MSRQYSKRFFVRWHDQTWKLIWLVGKVCCLPKVDKGFDIMSPHLMNEDFLIKILWNMINRLDDLGCKVVYSKYSKNTDLQLYIKGQPYDPPLWKTLVDITDNLWSCMVQRVENRQQVKFRLNNWMPDGSSLTDTPTIDMTFTMKNTPTKTGN
jgi:hypothetical protein